MLCVTRGDGVTFHEHVDPSDYHEDCEDMRPNDIAETRFACCECMFVERNARCYPCDACKDNMLVKTMASTSQFTSREADEVVYFDDSIYEAD